MRWSYDAARQVVRVGITQAQAGKAVRLPIEIGFADAAGGKLRMEKLLMDAKTQDFTVPVTTAPAALILDPDTELLADMSLTRKRL